VYSIQLGLKEADPGQYCFIQNVDQPFVDTEMIVALASKGSKECSVSPYFDEKGGHPVLLGPGLLQFISDCTDEQATLNEVLNFFPKKKLNIRDQKICININATADYKKVFGREPETV
jgi:CTP:molybdopterin cytidylyltransferase MocA